MKIQLFTDLRFTTNPRPTGVGKHIVQLATGLASSEAHDLSLLVAGDQAAQHQAGALAAMDGHRLPLPWKASEAVWNLTGRPYMDRWSDQPDWVYCPKNDFIPIKHSRVAVTIHGAHELDPEFPQSSNLSSRINRIRRRLSYRRMLEQADLVFTVSTFLQQQMMDWFQVPEEKFCVVGNGVESEFFEAAELPFGRSGERDRGPYVLCVGGLNRLDGGDRMLGLAAALQASAPDMRVLLAGADHEADLLAQAEAHPNLQLLGYTLPQQLAAYIKDAFALFYPTRYETFGIAAAEAMAVGTPVVTCRSTAVPEIVGDAGIYVNPESAAEAADAIANLLRDSSLWQKYSSLGIERAQSYTWQACVDRVGVAFVANG